MSFEKLRVYQAAVLLDQEVRRLAAQVDRGHASDLDHLKRAVGSILFNIPEANGSVSPGRKRYHLEVARGAADECRAILKRLVADGALEAKEVVRANGLTSAIAKMLNSMMRSIKHRAQ
jgi:four helix bundle protein